MSLVQTLPNGALDIIGDIHGEYLPLRSLLDHLGYSEDGSHPKNRMLVFVGDFCDRGPDSPAVLQLIRKLVTEERAFAILGNHEINLLRGEAKDGSGWFFDERFPLDQDRYSLFKSADSVAKSDISVFLKSLPVALERDDLRIVHAAWINEHIATIRAVRVGDILTACEKWEHVANRAASEFIEAMSKEREVWQYSLESPEAKPPLLVAHANYAAAKQMNNPIKVLTGGVERKGNHPFFSNGRWRFVERIRWWDDYSDQTPVVIGHFWRKSRGSTSVRLDENGDADMFESEHANAWHGKNRNVFCVDFSIGGRSRARKMGHEESDFRLAALRWPERTLQFHDGSELNTRDFEHGEV